MSSGFPPRHRQEVGLSRVSPPLGPKTVAGSVQRVAVDRVSPPSRHMERGKSSGNPTGLVGHMERGKPPSPTNRINLLDGTWALPPLLSVWKRTGKELAASIWSVTADRVSPPSRHVGRRMEMGREPKTFSRPVRRGTRKKRMESTRLRARLALRQEDNQTEDLRMRAKGETQGDEQWRTQRVHKQRTDNQDGRKRQVAKRRGRKKNRREAPRCRGS